MCFCGTRDLSDTEQASLANNQANPRSHYPVKACHHPHTTRYVACEENKVQ